MQSQMSSANAPNVNPQPPATTGPVAVAHGKGNPRRGWILGLIALVAGGAGLYYYKTQPEKPTALVVPLRTAAVGVGKLSRTLRVTGTTTAEKYTSLIAPSLRGSRGQGGGAGGGSAIGATRTTTVTSNAGAGSSSSSGSVSSGSLGSTSSAMDGSSAGGARTSSAPRSPSGTKGATAAASRNNNSVVDDNLGSTTGQLAGTGGGGGGTSGGGGSRGPGGDYALLLQQVSTSGHPVKKNEQVAEFDRQYMLTRLDDYRSSVAQSEATFRKQMADLKITRKAHEQTILAAKNAMEKADLDLKTLPVRSAIQSERLRLALEETKARYTQLMAEVKYVEIGDKAQTRSSEIDLEQSRNELKRAELNADKMLVKAPMNGVVVMQSTFRGSEFGSIQQGDQVYPGQMYMQIVDPSSMIINANVNQVDVESMKIGQQAKVRFDAYPGLELPARVVMIGALAKSSGTRISFKKEIPIRLRLDRMDPRVIPDLSVSADVLVAEEEAQSLVPLETLFDTVSIKEAAAESAREMPVMKAFVYVKSGELWTRREVQVGTRSYTHAAIRSGLKPGEIVAAERPPDPSAQSKQS